MWYQVSDSAIHGKGLFAARRIPEGTQIVRYRGVPMSMRDLEEKRMCPDEKAKYGDGTVYLFMLDDATVIDGDVPENDARFMNHSCDENCEAVAYGEEIWLVALRPIEEGEELTFDYGFSLGEGLDHPCCCGKDGCAGFMVRKDLRWKFRRMVRKR